MKQYFLILFSFFNIVIYAQILNADYNFTVNNKMTKNTYVFPANLKFDKKSQTKFYKVQFGIERDVTLPDNFFTSKKKPVYFIYSKPKSPILIFENVPNVKEVDYVFNDDYEMKWNLIPESKTFNNIKLQKAETDFRGRHYIAWYDDKVKTPAGPWKFKNTPGLIYEVYDSEGGFKWSLINLNENDEEIKNPFDSYTGEIVSFHRYPELRYGLTPELKKEREKVPNNQLFEQERNGLEIKFEWEK